MTSTPDLVIRGGNIADGKGGDLFEADVAITGGRITEVGKVSGKGKEEIDARGKLVAPGFVDVHTHYDGQVTWSQDITPSSQNGVTTAIMGNCGVGFAPCRPSDHVRLGNILDAFHQLDQPDMVARPARREADPAITHDRGGDAVLRGRRDVLAPGDLAVIMGVDIDKAGRDQFAPGVDLFLAFAGDLADLGDAAAGNGDISLIEIAALAVGNVAAADHEIRGRGHADSSRFWFCCSIILRPVMLSIGRDEVQECNRAFSSEVDTSSREENASKQKPRA